MFAPRPETARGKCGCRALGRAITAIEALEDATDFARDIWRDAWGVQGLFALGVALVFVSIQAGLPSAIAWDLGTIGWALLLATILPLTGALIRLNIGGVALRDLGPLGLQFGRGEACLFVLAIAGAGASLLALLPLVAVSAIVFIVFHGLGMASLPLLGEVRIPFLIAAAVWIAGLGAYVYAGARLSLAPVATVGKRHLVLAQAWALGEGQVGAVLGALVFSLCPLILTVGLLVWMDGWVTIDPILGRMRTWDLPQAALGGVVLGAVMAFIQIPVALGVISAVYCAQRERRLVETRALEPPPPPVLGERATFGLR